MPAADWTEERTELLRKLWADGLSCSMIAAAIGGFTRNAIIGKVSRLGLGGRRARVTIHRPPRASKPTVPGQRGASAEGRRRLSERMLAYYEGRRAERAVEVAAARVMPEPPTCEPITFMELRPNTCRWPIGDPREPSLRFCGSTETGAGPYCPYHQHLAYVPASQVKRAEVAFSRLASFGGRR